MTVKKAGGGSSETSDDYTTAVHRYEAWVHKLDEAARLLSDGGDVEVDLGGFLTELRVAEERAVAAHRRLFGGPAKGDTLSTACVRLDLPWPRGHGEIAEEAWMERLLRLVPHPHGEWAREILIDARTLARADMLFSAERFLQRFQALLAK